MLARIGLAHGEKFLAALCDERFVFAMCSDNDAKFFGQFQRAIKLRVIHAKRSLVGEKDFE